MNDPQYFSLYRTNSKKWDLALPPSASSPICRARTFSFWPAVEISCAALMTSIVDFRGPRPLKSSRNAHSTSMKTKKFSLKKKPSRFSQSFFIAFLVWSGRISRFPYKPPLTTTRVEPAIERNYYLERGE